MAFVAVSPLPGGGEKHLRLPEARRGLDGGDGQRRAEGTLARRQPDAVGNYAELFVGEGAVDQFDAGEVEQVEVAAEYAFVIVVRAVPEKPRGVADPAGCGDGPPRLGDEGVAVVPGARAGHQPAVVALVIGRGRVEAVVLPRLDRFVVKAVVPHGADALPAAIEVDRPRSISA